MPAESPLPLLATITGVATATISAVVLARTAEYYRRVTGHSVDHRAVGPLAMAKYEGQLPLNRQKLADQGLPFISVRIRGRRVQPVRRCRFDTIAQD